LVKLVVLQIIDFVEDDHFFPMLSFMKTNAWNQLTNVHLEVVIHIFSQKKFKAKLSFWNNNSELEGR
jgi:hypothetical protein